MAVSIFMLPSFGCGTQVPFDNLVGSRELLAFQQVLAVRIDVRRPATADGCLGLHTSLLAVARGVPVAELRSHDFRSF